MDHATHWSVDELAAGNLLAQLKIDASDDLIDIVTRHFSEHRRNLVGWAAERMQSAIIEEMESAAPRFSLTMTSSGSAASPRRKRSSTRSSPRHSSTSIPMHHAARARSCVRWFVRHGGP